MASLTRQLKYVARIAQLVEQRIENPCVGGSNPPSGTIFLSHNNRLAVFARSFLLHITRISKKHTYVQFWMLRAVLYWGIVGGVGLALVSA